MNSNLKYELALQILHNMIWFCFQDLEAERSKNSPDSEMVAGLKSEFAKLCARRDGLATAGDGEWETVIGELGPVSKDRAAVLKV